MTNEKGKVNTDLTLKQKVFCEEYIIDFNGARAAIKAGYSEKTARSIAAENLTKPNVQKYLAFLMEARAERVKISQDEVLEELKHIAFDDIKNYLDFRTEKVFKGYDDKEKAVFEYQTIVDLKDSREIDTRSVSEVSLASNGAFKFKLYGKDEALVQLGRHLGMFTDKVEMDGALTVNFNIPRPKGKKNGN